MPAKGPHVPDDVGNKLYQKRFTISTDTVLARIEPTMYNLPFGPWIIWPVSCMMGRHMRVDSLRAWGLIRRIESNKVLRRGSR